MRFISWSTLQLALLWLDVAYGGPTAGSYIDPSKFPEADRVTVDAVVIGGGASGTYGAIRLKQLGKSVIVVEKKGRLGGHTETYTDPVTGISADYGVTIFDKIPVAYNYFASLKIPVVNATLVAQTAINVDFSTGELIYASTPNAETPAAFQRYAAELAKYPYLDQGYLLPDPVPEDLLIPFREFITKYKLEDAASSISLVCQGVGDFLSQPTLYILKYFHMQVVIGFANGFLAVEDNNNSALYTAAENELGEDAWLSSTVSWMRRDADKDVINIVVKTPDGRKLITTKKVLFAIPPLLSNLRGVDLDRFEWSLFRQWKFAYYYTSLLANTGIPANTSVTNRGADLPYNLNTTPGPYIADPRLIPDTTTFYYDGGYELDDPEEVKQRIVEDILRLQNAGIPATEPEFLAFSDHTPFELTVSREAIAGGFYKRLYQLQGRRNTYWTGAAFHVHDSAMLWQFTEDIVQRMIQ